MKLKTVETVEHAFLAAFDQNERKIFLAEISKKTPSLYQLLKTIYLLELKNELPKKFEKTVEKYRKVIVFSLATVYKANGWLPDLTKHDLDPLKNVYDNEVNLSKTVQDAIQRIKKFNPFFYQELSVLQRNYLPKHSVLRSLIWILLDMILNNIQKIDELLKNTVSKK